MSLAPWRSPLAHALHRNRALVYSRYFQLATVDEGNQPANRTVVFRGFLEGGDRLKIVTDTRSEKAGHIEHHPLGEICWYFPKTREQFRLGGTLTLVHADHPDATLQQTRQTQWRELSEGARLQFAWSHPGKPRSPEDDFNPPPPDPSIPLDNFALLLLDPHRVDHLELRGEPQNRRLYSLGNDGTWTMEEVNP